MPELIHLNVGWLHSPPLPPACCHGLMVRTESRVVLIDTGIGMHDVEDPEGRIGREVIEAAGFRFRAEDTAVRQLARMGLSAEDVTDVMMTHCDPDHAGGLSDFPAARVHLALEEMTNVMEGNPRYCPAQFAHGPRWVTVDRDDSEFFGLPARRVLAIDEVTILLVPLFGHTRGHCGVAVHDGDGWTLHVGDAYYLRDELANRYHPIDALATLRADDDSMRVQSLDRLRDLTSGSGASFAYTGYHDSSELPDDIPRLSVEGGAGTG